MALGTKPEQVGIHVAFTLMVDDQAYSYNFLVQTQWGVRPRELNMASIHKDRKSSNYSIRFRYEGRNVNRSLRTSDRRKASGICSRIEETLRLLEGGRIEIPATVEPLDFIFSDGKMTGKTPTVKTKSLGLEKFYSIYEQRLPKGRKEASTLYLERIHLKHLKRYLGPNRKMQFITKANLQQYVAKRLQDTHHDKPIQPDTVRKELVTFRMLWNWGVQEGLLTGLSPTKYVEFPLTDEKPPFMTCEEIKKIIARGGLTEAGEGRLWESVYLETSEISDILEYVRKNARCPFIYPMMVFVAHTSARRSEMVRSLIEDIDFRSRTVVLREKKRSRTKAMTFRRVDMSPLLYRVLQEWLQNHPGGQHTFCQLRGFQQVLPLTVWQAHHHLKQTMANSDWSFLTGFHVFRHSFASNLAAAEVDQRVIDEFMGHQTEEMRRRYRHLFPAQRRAAIESIYGEEGDRKQDSFAS